MPQLPLDPLQVSMLVALGLLIVTPLTLRLLQRRRAVALGRQPVAAGWDLPEMAELDRTRLALYRMSPLSSDPLAALQIRDQQGRRVGRVEFSNFEPPRVELNGREFTVYDQGADRRHLWRGRVGGTARDSVVVHADGKPVAEIFRARSGLKNRLAQLAFHNGKVSIDATARGHGLDFRFGRASVARVARARAGGATSLTFAAIAASARPEFAAGVLYLAATQQR